MPEPTRPANKDALLAMIQECYDQFETLIAAIPAERMNITGVNDSWSVKDHLAHLAAWHTYQAARMQASLDGAATPPEPVPGQHTEDEDEINAYFYQQHKDEPLADVLAEFRASY